MTVQRLMAVLGMAAGLVLFGAVPPATADVVDDLEDIGPDCEFVVTTRVIGGVTVTIFTQGETSMTARTYYDGTCLAFGGYDGGDNAPLNPENVSGMRFISSSGPSGLPDAQPIIFELDAPVSSFGLTTLDLLEFCDTVDPTLTLRGFNALGNEVDAHTRVGEYGPSGLDLDWFVSGDGIVRVELAGEGLGDCMGYGIDDLLLDAPDCDGDGIFDDKDVCPCVPAPGGVDAEGRPLGDLDSDCDVDMDDFAIMQQNFTGPD